MNTQILSSIRKIFAKHFMFRPYRLSYKQDLYKDLSINRYELNEMLLYVESEFHIEIDDKEVPAIHTIGDLVYCVEKHRLQ
jgi:acyl carrier protein